MVSHRTLVRPVSEIAYRIRPQISKPQLALITQRRFASDEQKTSPLPDGEHGANESQLPHVTEEQAAMDKSMGNTPPDISQGTPVQEMLSRDKDAQKNAPQVLKQEMKDGQQKRSYSTSARRPAAELQTTQQPESQIIANGMIRGMDYPDAGPGHKFPLPEINSISRLDHLKRRYDPVVEQVTKSLMKDGKLSVAQKNMSEILTFLQTAPAPQPNPAFPQRTLQLSDTGSTQRLQPTHPTQGYRPAPSPLAPPSSVNDTTGLSPTRIPRSALPLHPVEYLTTLIDSVSPLVKIRQQKGLAGGGQSLPIPVPLGVRQRRRTAIQWILNAADGRREIRLSERVAKELLRVADGTSSVWERRAMVHRLGVASRSNVTNMMRRKRGARTPVV
ncbi:hypothetical protein LTR64_000433 [Lithohypha guttulata]|uniref:uncharacterized protein n=1 Tax=Lithohypha guttulata TaxID=1690604 RepID=UPI00315CC21D